MKTLFLSTTLSALFIITNLIAQEIDVTTSWVGNTFNGSNGQWVMNYANKMQIHPDGTLITASEWDEDGRNVGIFKDGLPVALIKGPSSSNCWGWGTATKAVAIDDNYLYVNNCEGDILRFNRANDNYNYVDKTTTGEAIGMTYSNDYIYMIKESGEVQKRSVSELSAISLSFSVAGGEDVAVDDDGYIWILTSNKEVLKYDASGTYTGAKIDYQPGWEPAAVNYDAFNNRLMVPDNGPRRQVIIFDTSGSQTGTFGEPGGISGDNPGAVGDLRFWNISGAGTDAQGNIFVVLNENSVSLRKFNPDGLLQWEVKAMFFTDIASIDPESNGTDIYGNNERMAFDYETQQWSLKAITCDRIAYPDDPRSGEQGTAITSALVRRVEGQLLMFTTGMYSGYWDVFRFDGEIAVFCQNFSNLGWATWPDKDGNIWYENNQQISMIPLTGFSAGCPQFGTPQVIETTVPAPFNKLERIKYDVDKDVMYLAGWTSENPNINNDWGIIGSTVARYPDWSLGNRTASHTAVMNTDVEGYMPKAFSVENDYLFTGGSRDRGKLHVYNANDLSYTGFINPPGNWGTLGWLDIVHAIQSYQRWNNEYVILVEDNARGKNLVYQWCPTGDCIQDCTETVDSVSIDTSSVDLQGAETLQLTATVFPDSVCLDRVDWHTSDASVVEISYSGLIKGRSVGSAWISAKSALDENKKDSILVTVSDVPLTGISLETDTLFLPIGNTATIPVSFLPPNALNKNLVWTSTDNDIATVDENGLISGIMLGDVFVIAASEDGGFTDSCYVVVTELPVESIELRVSEINVWMDDFEQINVNIFPEDAYNKEIIWTIENEDIATIDQDGVVTAVNSGNTFVIATSVDGGFTDTCQVNVLDENVMASQDIGNVCGYGSITHTEDGKIIVLGNGNDIWGNADEFHYGYFRQEGDGVMVARVRSMENTDSWAKAGVMMRETAEAGSKHAIMALTPGNGTSFQRRGITDGGSDHTTPGDGIIAPYWVKIVRQGNMFKGYKAIDGRDWIQVGSIEIDMAGRYYAGLAVTAHHSSCVLNESVFDWVFVSDDINQEFPVPGNDATLTDLMVDGSTIDGFDPALLNYQIILAEGTTQVPTVDALQTDENAILNINQASGLPGVATIEVTAEDSFTRLTYRIDFSIATAISDLETHALQIYPNPASNFIHIVIPEQTEKSTEIRIYDSMGRLKMASLINAIKEDDSVRIDLSQLSEGFYILELETDKIYRSKILIKKQQ